MLSELSNVEPDGSVRDWMGMAGGEGWSGEMRDSDSEV